MEVYNRKTLNHESSWSSLLLFRFLPYWPLFILLLITCCAAAWTYLNITIPLYEISATVLLKDEKKGVDDSRSIEFLNIYRSKTIVENEIEVIRSKTVVREVVDNLHLYAPVWEEGAFQPRSAFNSSPVTIEAKEPALLKEIEKIHLSFLNNKNVQINKKLYVLNQWVNTPYGVLRFTHNKNKTYEAKNPLYFSLMPPKEVVNKLLKKLQVNPVSKVSTVIILSLKDEVPERGEFILNEITDAYNRAALNEKNALAANSLAFIEDRLKIVGSSLDSIERAIQQYKSKEGAIDISTQGKLFLENVSNNDRKLADISNQLAVLDKAESYVVSKNSKTGIVPATLGVDDPILKQLLQRLSEAELQYESLKQTIPENNSVLISLAKEIEQIRPGIVENIHNQQVALQASKSNMNASGNTYSSVLQSLPYKEKRLLEISRQQSVESNVYSFLLQKREEMELSYAAAVSDSQIIDRGESSVKPVSPKKLIVFLIALASALGLSIAIVIGREFLTGKILFRSDIESYTQIPVAAEIANIKHKQELVVIDHPQMAFIAEQFRQLSAAIGLYGKQISNKKLLVTSGIAGEGKSFLAANLALSLADSGKRVILLDMDLRNPKSSSIFGLRQEPGISEYLNNEKKVDEIIKQSEYNNLFIIPAGRATGNSTELLLKGDLARLFISLEDLFDHILVDVSPVNPVTDAFIISEYCDKTLFIIRHGFTPKTLVQLMDDNNKIKAFRNISIVFNGLNKRGFIKGGYGFGYGFGYEYVYNENGLSKNKQVII